MPKESLHKIYLITGATRGIGLCLVEDIAARDPIATIYAAGRNPSGSARLVEVAKKYPGRIEFVKYVSGDKEGNEEIAEEIRMQHGRIDTVIANAGINNCIAKVHEIPPDNFQEHFAVNVLGSIVLFQAVRGLLNSTSQPRFVTITSMVGSAGLLSEMGDIDIGAYGTSKAALNWVTRKIHFENEWLVAFPVCPGPVITDMSKNVVSYDESGGVDDHFRETWRQPDVAAHMLMDIIKESTREKDGGQFHSIEGGRHPW